MTDYVFNAEDFFAHLDEIFAQGRANTDAHPFLMDQLRRADDAHNRSAQLTIICELLGFDRSHALHEESTKLCAHALELRDELGLAGTKQGTIVLIDVATAYRQAGHYESAEKVYKLAAHEADFTFDNKDRRKAALYNNLSMLYSETGRSEEALESLDRALELMQESSPDPDADIDVATTLTNLGLLELQLSYLEQADSHTAQALKTYEDHSNLQQSAHFASALAGRAQTLFLLGKIRESSEMYERALDVIRAKYGESSDYFTITQENAKVVREALAMRDKQPSSSTRLTSPEAKLTGLALAEQYWHTYADELFSGELAQIRSRAAVGLSGHGSECYGYDDEISRDHDFGPRFCIWLTHEDYELYGNQLQERYTALPDEFMGVKRSAQSPRGGGRDGVMSIDSFFESITGLSQAPQSHGEEHLWLSLDEATLAAATNGKVFADPLGAFSSRRNAFKHMPDDVRLYLISQRLGMISQTGQYNYSRMTQRGDASAVVLTLSEFARNVSSLIFLLNTPASAGYAPYYKWRFAALRTLSKRMGTRLADLCPLLEDTLVQPTQEKIDQICARIVDQLVSDGLSTSHEDFLEWHRPYIESHISSDSPLLHSLTEKNTL